MENHISHPFQQFIQKSSKKPSSIMDTVMPLYQVIRFASQAFEKKQMVSITIERPLANGQFCQTTLKGKFRSKVNKNKQVAFSSHHDAVLHLLRVEQILAIQLA